MPLAARGDRHAGRDRGDDRAVEPLEQGDRRRGSSSGSRRRLAVRRRRRPDRGSRSRRDRDPGPVRCLCRLERRSASACPVDVEIVSLDPRTLSEVAGVDPAARRPPRRPPARRPPGRTDGGDDRSDGCARGGPASAPDLLRRVARARVLRPPSASGDDLAGRRCRRARNSGEPSRPVRSDDVWALAPELVVFGPCGFDAATAAQRAERIELRCPAVVVDGDACTPPGAALADGVRQLAHLLHPRRRRIPVRRRSGSRRESVSTSPRERNPAARAGPVVLGGGAPAWGRRRM